MDHARKVGVRILNGETVSLKQSLLYRLGNLLLIIIDKSEPKSSNLSKNRILARACFPVEALSSVQVVILHANLDGDNDTIL